MSNQAHRELDEIEEDIRGKGWPCPHTAFLTVAERSRIIGDVAAQTVAAQKRIEALKQ